MSRVTGLAHVVGAFLLVSLVVLSGVASAQSEQCPAFTADEIDIAFDAWSEFIGLVPDSTNIICYDDPIAPAIRFEVEDIRSNDALLLVFVQRDVAGCSFRIMGETTNCIKVETEMAPWVPDGHICREQILHSIAWRQHCKDIIARGQYQD